jgi:hypothetical protein
MGLFDRTTKHLANGPTLLLPADATADLDALLKAYAPDSWVRSDYLVLGNGVLLLGPVEVTPDLAEKARLPVDSGVAYYTDTGVMKKREERSEDKKRLDGERLVRGLAARLHAAKHSKQPWAEASLDLSIWAEQPVHPDPVMNVLQPFVGVEDDQQLFVRAHEDVPGGYFLFSERDPAFVTMFLPNEMSHPKLFPPPPAVGPLRTKEPCQWQLLSTHADVADADAETRTRLSTVALALADAVHGVVTDMFGFPINRPEDLVNG